jgi:hypothetical protein
METKTPAEANESLSRQELFDLHRLYKSIEKDQLGFCYQYLNFYTGFLSALLAATLVALLNMRHGMILELALLLGPGLTVALAIIGYLNVRVFYRRFVEAWVTTVNIESMLRIRYATPVDLGKDKRYTPKYTTVEGGFIAMFERKPIQATLDVKKTADAVLTETVKKGDTLRYALWTFIMFVVGSLLLGVVIVLTAFPNLI